VRPPDDLTITALGDRERVTLARPKVRSRRERCVLLVLIFGSIAGSLFGAFWVATLSNLWVGLPLALLLFLGAMGDAPVLMLELHSRLQARIRHPLTLTLTPISCQLGRQVVRWGEVDTITVEGESLLLRLDDGTSVRFPLPGQPRQTLQWLAAHLQDRLEQHAPGSPEEVPAQLAALRDQKQEP
jgi:hypothetical protein